MDGRPQLVVPPLSPFVRGLIIALAASFVVTSVLDVWFRIPVYTTLAITPGPPRISYLWQALTYVLVEPPVPQSLLGLLLTGLLLWLIMSPLEQRLGSKRIAWLTLFGALGPGIAGVIVAMAIGDPTRGGLLDPLPLSGASNVGLAGLAAFAVLDPDGRIYFMGALPIRGRHLLWFEIGLSVVSFILSRNPLQLVAMLAAIGVGVLFVRQLRTPRKASGRPPRRTGGPPLRVIRGGDDSEGEPPRYLN